MFAADSDVTIASTHITLPTVNSASENSLQTSTVDVLFRFDEIALEPNETFTLEFTFAPGQFGTNATLRDTFTGTVIDANSNAIMLISSYIMTVLCYFYLLLYNVEVTFQFSEADYRAVEGPGAIMPVVISKVSETLIATDVIFMVIPLTVDQALAQNVIDSFSTLDPFNPNRAGFFCFYNYCHFL